MSISRVNVRSIEEGARLAARVARLLSPTDAIGLTGELGAGKTTWIQALARAMKAKGPVTSPTFLLAQEYAMPKGVLYHLDLYRLSDRELADFPVEDYWGQGLCCVEWAERIRHRWPADMLWIRIQADLKTGRRRFALEGIGKRWKNHRFAS